MRGQAQDEASRERGQGGNSVSGLSTSELKARLREGQTDQMMVLELVRRMEEVELRSKTSSNRWRMYIVDRNSCCRAGGEL